MAILLNGRGLKETMENRFGGVQNVKFLSVITKVKQNQRSWVTTIARVAEQGWIKMTDLISRKEAINAVNKAFDRETLLNTFVRSIAIKALSTMPSAESQMTVAEYRERMIQAFHNADCDELIALVVPPAEKEFQQLEWLLKNEYVPFLE